MNYIILDLEWNSAYCTWQQRFINEIIEFGAVKLDERLNEISRFQCFVRSKLTNRLRSRVKGLTNISNEDMRGGVPFEQAAADYTAWAGENTVTLTWSNTDIYVLLDNFKTMMNTERIPFLYKYADAQKFVQNKMGVTGNQISLTDAAERMGVDFKEFAAHRALGDCLCTAELMRRTFDENGLKGYLVDAGTDEYYARLAFKPYIINDINSPEIDRSQMRFRCPDCGDFMRRKTKWRFKNRAFAAVFECKKCKKPMCGRVRFKKLFDGVAVSRSLTDPPAPTQSAQKTEQLFNRNVQGDTVNAEI